MKDMTPDSPYGVICHFNCGKQGLSKQEYQRQMSRPNCGWICPSCHSQAVWDDDRYQAGGEEEGVLGLPNEPVFSLPMDRGELEIIMQGVGMLRGALNGDMMAQVECIRCYAELAAGRPEVLDQVTEKLIKLGMASTGEKV